MKNTQEKTQKTCPHCNQGKMIRRINEDKNGNRKEKMVCNKCGKSYDKIVDNVNNRPSNKQSTILA